MIETLYDTPRTVRESAGSASLRELCRRYEARLVEDVLAETRWNVSAAARRLGLSRVGLTKKLKTLGIVRPGNS
jgi:DNA-binding NtrC family response regulator